LGGKSLLRAAKGPKMRGASAEKKAERKKKNPFVLGNQKGLFAKGLWKTERQARLKSGNRGTKKTRDHKK